MAEWRDVRSARHLVLLAMAMNLSGKPWKALIYSTDAMDLAGVTDAALTEQALALEQLGMRDLARHVWSMVRKRNPGLGSWRTASRAFLHQDPRALRRMERWRSGNKPRGA